MHVNTAKVYDEAIKEAVRCLERAEGDKPHPQDLEHAFAYATLAVAIAVGRVQVQIERIASTLEEQHK